jgi:acyl carrier protein
MIRFSMEKINPEDLNTLIRLVDRVKMDSSHQTSLETRLLEEAAIDSLALIDLVDEVQREMNVSFLPEDYSFENLSSVRTILDLVNRRRQSLGSPSV